MVSFFCLCISLFIFISNMEWHCGLIFYLFHCSFLSQIWNGTVVPFFVGVFHCSFLSQMWNVTVVSFFVLFHCSFLPNNNNNVHL